MFQRSIFSNKFWMKISIFFLLIPGRALCHECNDKVKASSEGKYMCQKCRQVIEGEPLRFRGEVYCPYHFNCKGCGKELTSSAVEVKTRPGYTANELNELYCLKCYFKMGIPICGACRRPIEGRVVTALGNLFSLLFSVKLNWKIVWIRISEWQVSIWRFFLFAISIFPYFCVLYFYSDFKSGSFKTQLWLKFRIWIPVLFPKKFHEIEFWLISFRISGKHWCVEHFVCAKCEKPFNGNRHYERKGLAYCETHYHQLFGNLCYVCNQVIQGDVFTALNKAWCVNHFACSSCDQKMTINTKFYEVDLKPVCKKCYDRYPRELRLRLKKYHENEAARDQGREQMNMTAKWWPFPKQWCMLSND